METPVIEGWFTTDAEPALLGSRCTTCATVTFPPMVGDTAFCPNPVCDGTEVQRVELARRGRVWSYTDAQYQPPPPYIPAAEDHRPFALAAVELPEGLVVLGQVAEGYGVADLRVGAEVELVVEPLHTDDTGVRTVWRWRPVTEPAAPAEQVTR